MIGYFFVLCLLLLTIWDCSYVIVADTSSTSASSSSDEYDNDDRLLARDKNDSRNANDTLLRGHSGVVPERLMRRDQSKDLKRLIQELEESDYSNYGSWGNFRSRPSPPPSSENYPSPEADIYRGNPDMTTVHEHEVFWDDQVDDGSNDVHSDGPYRTTNYDPVRKHQQHGGFGPRYPGGGLTGRHYSQPPSPPHDYSSDNYPLDEADVVHHQYQYHRDQRHSRPSSSSSWDYRDVATGSSGSTAARDDMQRWEDTQSDEETRLLPYHPYQLHDDPYPFHVDHGNMYAHRQGLTHHPTGAHYPPQPMTTLMSSRENRASRDMNGLVAVTAQHRDALSISRLDPKRELQFHSVLSLTSVLVFCAIGAYLSVTPRLPNTTGSTAAAAGERLLDLFSSLTSMEHDATLMSIYNHSFKQIFLRLLVGTFVWPSVVMIKAFRRCDADINQVIHTFVHSFTFGYVSTVIVQLIAATLIRLVVMHWLEPTIFHLCPHIPAIFLPWQLRECQASVAPGGTSMHVHIRHTTKMVISLLTTCVVAPVLEEYMKLVLFRWNFPVTSADKYQSGIWTNSIHTPQPQQQPPPPRGQFTEDSTRTSSIQPSSAHPPPTNPVRASIIGMLSASYGLKIADNVQRILSYNKLTPSQQHKTFFAILRGLFPIQELCGAMTAIKWAKYQQEQDLRWLTKQSSTAAAVLPDDSNHRRKVKEETKEYKGKGNTEKRDETTQSSRTAAGSTSIPNHPQSTTIRTSKLSAAAPSLGTGTYPLGRYRHRASFFRVVGDILWPAISLHAMANFRGMKPLFSWSSLRPWQEMQLQAWNAIDTSTPVQMLVQGGVNLLWFLWLVRLFAGVMKDYVAATQQHLHLLQLQLQLKMQSEQPRNPPTANNNHHQPQQQQQQQQRRQQYRSGPYLGQGQSNRPSSSNNSPR